MFNDLTFFTNEEGRTILDRFNTILRDRTQFFDVLVGYFRISGFNNIYKSLETVEKIRILVGLDVDKKTIELLSDVRKDNLSSTNKIKEKYIGEVVGEVSNSEDTENVEIGINNFIKFIEDGKLEIRYYPYADIHAKLYIMRKYKECDRLGSIITGSSNFSQAGLVDSIEFNVELKDNRDIYFALEKFERLWAESIELSEECVNTIKEKTWINDRITPYDLYLKFIYEYFKEKINNDKYELNKKLIPSKYKVLQYQIDAVNSAREILEAYNGVFLSDVVGLGKTNIAAMLAKTLSGQKIVICPPVLIKNWNQVLVDYDVAAKVFSLGMLDSIFQEDLEDVKYVFIDEAHRFRNEQTESFSKLHNICLGKKVVLISATPQNNYSTDIQNQIFLFQPKNKSTIIPNEQNIELFFKRLNNKLKACKDNKLEYRKTLKANSEIIRDKVLRTIMIRRTREEITTYYGDDLLKQGLKFPKLNNPYQVIYIFNEKTEKVFNDTLDSIKKLSYARYKPLTFLKAPSKEYNSLLVGQKNLGGFMKSILLKRLESSFFAFYQTLSRFIDSYEKFIHMFKSGQVYISKKVDVYDLLDSGDDEKLFELINEGKVQQFNSSEFIPSFILKLEEDLKILRDLMKKWKNIDYDPKLESFLFQLKDNETLKTSKLIIFTESKETADYLKLMLDKADIKGIIKYSGESSDRIRATIEENFNPNTKAINQKDEYRILITTDILAEGINLHRANVVINYDLPWNPTKVMQRVGRINRVGSVFDELYVYNFFPTSVTDTHLSLKENIIRKIQSFHDTLGEDFKYLSQEEEVNSFGLLGQDNYSSTLYEMLSNIKNEEDDENVTTSELKYLKLLREIRDNDETLYLKIKTLPRKIRVARAGINNLDTNLVTFFRKGYLKKIYLSDKLQTEEITFDNAIRLIQCDSSVKSVPISNEYFDLLNKNKIKFISAVEDGEVDKGTDEKRNLGNVGKILKYLKLIRKSNMLTDIDEALVDKLYDLWEQGVIPSSVSKKCVSQIKGESDEIKLLNIIKSNVDKGYLNNYHNEKPPENVVIETILSLQINGGNL